MQPYLYVLSEVGTFLQLLLVLLHHVFGFLEFVSSMPVSTRSQKMKKDVCKVLTRRLDPLSELLRPL